MVVNNVVSDNNVVSNNNVVSDEKYTYSQLVDRFVNFKDSYVGKQSSVCKKLQRACFVEYDSFGVEKYKPIKHLTKSQ